MRSGGLAALALACAAAGCVGDVGDDDGEGVGGRGGTSVEAESEIGAIGLRRLSVAEYQQTVVDLLGTEPVGARELLPVDTLAPFDNDYTLQTPSEALIKGAELLAGTIAEAVLADAALVERVVGCTPVGAVDDACFRSFIARFGRRALRRPLEPAEVDKLAAFATLGAEAGDFRVGVGAVLRAFLQHPELLYRVEIGTPVAEEPGVFRLGDFELATRMSYFLIGSTPPDWLLDAAEHGELATPDGLGDAAARLFADARARARIQRFHAMWLSYGTLSDAGVSGMMHDETNALIEKVVFEENRPWTDILTADETWLSPELAQHYGLDSPGTSAGWVSYASSGRKGLLSHGTFLSAVSKFGDTSPTQRGRLVRTQLFCQDIAPPPPTVNADEPPDEGDPDACKTERYFMKDQPECSGCHLKMDPIGFGLEAYGADGRFRAVEPGKPECEITGDGDFVGLGTFNGPAELADLAVDSGIVEACVAKQLYRFAVGHLGLDQGDLALVDALVKDASSDGGLTVQNFVQSYVRSEAFRFRREEDSE